MTRELSPQQRRVMALVARGMQNKHISDELGISLSTVKSHVYRSLAALGVKNRTQAALLIACNPIAEAELSQ